MLLLDPLARPIIAHRGDRAHAPENTMLAFERALSVGAEAIELDVHVSADGNIVVCHDPSVDRTTDGTGLVESMSLDALREVDAGARWSLHRDPERANGGLRDEPTPFRGQGLRIPLLSDVFESFPATPLIIELKTERVGAAIVPLLTRHGVRERVVLGSFLDAALRPARAAGFRTTASQPEIRRLLARAVLHSRATSLAFDVVSMPPSYFGIPLPLAGYVSAVTVPVHVWTVNDPRRAHSLWKRGVRGILTDDPAAIAAARRAIVA